MKIKKTIFLVLAVCTLLSVFASCADKPDNIHNSGESSEVNSNASEKLDSQAAETELPEENFKEQYAPDFGKTDMNGYVFRIGTRDDSTHGYPMHLRDLYAEEENGDLINDATYRRNSAIEEKYNCKIEAVSFSHSNPRAASDIVKKARKPEIIRSICSWLTYFT